MGVERASQAIILAAGRGSRMGGLTAEQPKCFTEIAGRRLLDWQMDALTEAGITSLIVLRGYRKELLSSPRFDTIDNDEWASTNMVATLRCAARRLEQAATVVSYSDIVYHPDHVRALAASDGDIAMTYDRQWEGLWSARFANPLDDAETFRQEDGWLKNIGEKTTSLADIQGQYMGLLKITPRGWASIGKLLDALTPEQVARLDMTSLLRRLLSEGVPVRCVPVEGQWCEVDCGTDVATYQSLLAAADQAGNRWSHDWRWQGGGAAGAAG
ncbi:MAG: NTP transferase domain-containing protein [Solirubrobacterales bacterium]